MYEHGFAFARSPAFYQTMLFWPRMHLPGDVVLALGALLMAWVFIVKLRPLYSPFIERLLPRSYEARESKVAAEQQRGEEKR